MAIPQIPDKKYFTIGETARITGIKPYVLRYWESEFKLLRPARRESGQRRYVRKDLETIFTLKELLHEQRFSIEGAKKKLKELQKKPGEQPELFGEDRAANAFIKEVIQEVKSILKIMS